MPSGETVEYKAYERIFYVTNVEDSISQTLNIYVPDDLKGRQNPEIPVFIRQYVGGYRASNAKPRRLPMQAEEPFRKNM